MTTATVRVDWTREDGRACRVAFALDDEHRDPCADLALIAPWLPSFAVWTVRPGTEHRDAAEDV